MALNVHKCLWLPLTFGPWSQTIMAPTFSLSCCSSPISCKNPVSNYYCYYSSCYENSFPCLSVDIILLIAIYYLLWWIKILKTSQTPAYFSCAFENVFTDVHRGKKQWCREESDNELLLDSFYRNVWKYVLLTLFRFPTQVLLFLNLGFATLKLLPWQRIMVC